MARSYDPQLRLEGAERAVWGSVAVAAVAGASYHRRCGRRGCTCSAQAGLQGVVCARARCGQLRERAVLGRCSAAGVSRLAAVQLQLVGLSVLGYQRDALYTELVDTMLPDRGKNAAEQSHAVRDRVRGPGKGQEV